MVDKEDPIFCFCCVCASRATGRRNADIKGTIFIPTSFNCFTKIPKIALPVYVPLILSFPFYFVE